MCFPSSFNVFLSFSLLTENAVFYEQQIELSGCDLMTGSRTSSHAGAHKHTRTHTRARTHARMHACTRCTGPRLWCNGPTAINRNRVLFCAQLVLHTVKDLCTMFVSLVSEGPRELESGETNVYAVSYDVPAWLDVVSQAFGSWWKD